MLIVNRRIQIPFDEFRYTFARSSGPGGQNVNKVNSKVILHWPVESSPSLPEEVRRRFLAQNRNRINKLGELVLQCQRHRDQQHNISDCLTLLRELLLAAATAPKRRIATRPTRSSQRRRVNEKKARGQIKESRRKPGRDD
jgi:ribosome-associated protein